MDPISVLTQSTGSLSTAWQQAAAETAKQIIEFFMLGFYQKQMDVYVKTT
jgi:hypothetical protein